MTTRLESFEASVHTVGGQRLAAVLDLWSKFTVMPRSRHGCSALDVVQRWFRHGGVCDSDRSEQPPWAGAEANADHEWWQKQVRSHAFAAAARVGPIGLLETDVGRPEKYAWHLDSSV